jgi:bifunctional non-homologous end joining protein LigD
VRTRRGHDRTGRFKAIAADAARLRCRNAIIDGEAVVLDSEGRADFATLQDSLAECGRDAVLYAFDLPFLGCRSRSGPGGWIMRRR